MLIDGFNGHYCYKRMRIGGGDTERYAEGPDKSNPFTHIHDSLQYPIVAVTMGHVDFSQLRRVRTMNYTDLVGGESGDYGAL
jgi:hypothetical protein